MNIGNAFSDRVLGDRASNSQQAIHFYRDALHIYRLESQPFDWASVQIRLGIALGDLASGEPCEEKDQVIHCYENALKVCAVDTLPRDYASLQLSLAFAYRKRINGSRTENLRCAVDCHCAALRVRFHDSMAPPRFYSLQLVSLASKFAPCLLGHEGVTGAGSSRKPRFSFDAPLDCAMRFHPTRRYDNLGYFKLMWSCRCWISQELFLWGSVTP
jgi:hypothetical protein